MTQVKPATQVIPVLRLSPHKIRLANVELHERIQKARERAALSRRQLGERLDPPVTYQTVRTWELPPSNQEATTPRLDKFHQIAKITGVRLEWLLAEAGPMSLGGGDPIPADVLATSLRALSPEQRAKVIADAFDSGSE